MQNSKKIILLVVLLIVAGSYFFFRQTTKSDLATESDSIKQTSTVKKDITKSNKNKLIDKMTEEEISTKSESLSKFNDFTVEEKKSLLILSSFLSDAADGNLPKDLFVESLRDLKLKPVIMKSENEYTGSLDIVRTKDTLPGTRYVHAQYFEGENTPSFLQHLSFEFRGGKGAFEMVKQAIILQHNITKTPEKDSEAFISWHLADKNIWIKVLSLEDISQPNPYNSYDLKTDIGTIRVAVENEIH